jgi:hypothetical protein
MEPQYYNGLAGIVNGSNGKAKALKPGEVQFGNIRFHPQTNDKGEAIVRLHVTNEVEMLIVKSKLAWIKAVMWIAISALYLATGSGLIVYFRSY